MLKGCTVILMDLTVVLKGLRERVYQLTLTTVILISLSIALEDTGVLVSNQLSDPIVKVLQKWTGLRRRNYGVKKKKDKNEEKKNSLT